MKATVLLAAVGALALSGSALANEVKVYEGQGGPLVDFVNPNPGVARFEIFIPDQGEIKGIKEVLLNGLVHSWAGDLLITLTHKDTGTVVVLVDRPGVPESTFGESENYGGNYSFQDGFAPIPNEFVDGGTLTLPSGIYGPDATPGNALSNFVGENKFGVWSLQIVDFAGGDTGSLGGWVIVLNNVPAPGAMALLGLAGLAARRRRRSE